MPTLANDQRQQAIHSALAQRAGCTPDARAVAVAAVDTWQQVVGRLAPVIGERGVDVLLRRALHLTHRAFPWLEVPGEQGDSAVLLAGLKALLAGQATAVAAAAASEALLLNFCELLASLIGESLSWCLLAPVWAAPSAAPEQEKG